MKATLATVMLALLVSPCIALGAEPLEDVPPGHWALPAIQALVDAEILDWQMRRFRGDETLSRYDMAMWMAKVVDRGPRTRSASLPSPSPSPSEFPKRFEAETADLGARLERMVGEGEGLRERVEGMRKKEEGEGKEAERLRLSAMAGLGWIVESIGVAGRTRYEGGDSDQFDLSRLSLGVDARLSEGLSLHMQLDTDAASDDGSGRDRINEVYVDAEDFLGLRARFGAYAMPFSAEHRGPLRSCTFTITPSTLSTLLERVRLHGFHVEGPLRGGSVTGRAGLASGTDDFAPAYGGVFSVDDSPRSIETTETDGELARWLHVERRLPARRRGTRFAWQLGWYDDGSEPAAGTATPLSPRTDFFLAGLEYAHGKVRFLWQMADGKTVRNDVNARDWETTYILLNWKLRGRSSVTGRYERWDDLDETGQTMDSGGEKTLCFNRVLGPGSGSGLLQFELIKPKPGGFQKVLHLNQFQMRYTMWF